MQVLIILFGAFVLYYALGVAGVGVFATWLDAARAALSTMLAFTAAAHFGRCCSCRQRGCLRSTGWLVSSSPCCLPTSAPHNGN